MVRFTSIRAVAFDLDGTLVDSAPELADAVIQVFSDLKLPAPKAEDIVS